MAEGRSVAIVLALCVTGAALLRWLVLGADVRLARMRPSRRVVAGASVLVVVAALTAAVAADAPARLSRTAGTAS